MSIESLAALSRRLCSPSTIFPTKRNRVAMMALRSIYTHRDTGIPGLESYLLSVKDKKRLPNFLESCPYINQEEVEALYASFPAIIDDLWSPRYVQDLPESNLRTKKLLEHSLCYTPYVAAQTMMAHKFYSEQRKASSAPKDEEKRQFLAYKLAWGIEMNVRQFSMFEDYINSFKTRNGVPVWHSFPENVVQAPHDATVLGSGGLLVLKKWLEKMDCYGELEATIYELNFLIQVSENELLEMKKSQSDTYADATTLEHVRNMKSLMHANGTVVNTAVVSAMLFNGKNDPELIKLAKEIGKEVMTCTTFFDDYACCFGGELVNDEVGRDIKTGKLTWLLVKAKELGSSDQCRRLEENYGKSDPACVEEVMRVYGELNIGKIILGMAEEEASGLEAKISKLPQKDLPCFIWLHLINHYRQVAGGTLPRIL